MKSNEKITLQWHGAAHYHIFYKDLRIIIDPLYTRLDGEQPRLKTKKEDLDKVDYLLLTHGHLDHSWDFGYIVKNHAPITYAPKKCLAKIQKEENLEPKAKWHSLEDCSGSSFEIDDITVTPFHIGTEEIDFWFFRDVTLRPLRHGKPGALPTGLKWLATHLFDNCFAFHFQFEAKNKTMLYLGNLTKDVSNMDGIERVNVLAIPYCPANNKWLEESQYLIKRFNPDVTLVHHFDNFMHPFTHSQYMNLETYRHGILEECPTARLYFSKFFKKIDFDEIASFKADK